ncbi:Rv3654c family TadE-like protein [Actinomadura yumaensis]|uniref:Rv3654c family TadE-like protein n=1 Tax=Actinomadura yumaensis TaxID=111807 RepID=A0ABW2CQW1_9ACTN
MRLRLGDDRGSGTVWTAAFMAVVWLAATTAMAVGAVRAARHKADSAADLAALAAAGHVGEGAGGACRRAAAIATGSGGRLSVCSVRGRIVDVTVTMVLDAPFGAGVLRVVSQARAGPVGADGVG